MTSWVPYNEHDELVRAMQEIERLRAVVGAAEALQARLAHHFSGTYDWKEQIDLRDALAAIIQ